MLHRLAARFAAACCAALLCCGLAAPAALAASLGQEAAPAQGATAQQTSFSLLSEQPWVSGPSGVSLTLGVDSPLPATRLGMKIVLYSEVSTRDAFALTLSGTEPASEVPIDSVPTGRTLPLAGLLHNGQVALQLPVQPGATGSPGSLRAPTLFLDCASSSSYCPGVYPLQLVLFDTAQGRQLATLTTYLIYAPHQSGTLPLESALVLPLGNHPAAGPDGSARIGAQTLDGLGNLANAIEGLPPDSISVDLHPQLLTALSHVSAPAAQRSAAAAVIDRLATALGGKVPTEELLGTTYARVDPTALANAGLGGEVATQLGVARRVTSSTLHTVAGPNPYVADSPLGPSGLVLLHAAGVNDLVVPGASLSATGPAGTTVAPYRLAAGSPDAGGLVFAADAGLGAVFDRPGSDAALAAMRFLAELAVVYFEEPFSSVRRAVVVAPATDGSSGAFLDTVLAGLADSPIVTPVTLSSLTSQFAHASGLKTTTLLAPRTADAPSAAAVAQARDDLQTLDSVVPGARAVTIPISDALLLGETAGMPAAVRARYENAARTELGRISRSLSLAGARTVTLTARTGRVPITVSSQFPATVDVVLRVRSSDLTFPEGTRFPLALSTQDHSALIAVRSLTSGATTLSIALAAPRGNLVLRSEQLSIHSTAISGVAIALSVAALLVLAAWWGRSLLRSRREGGRRRREPPAPAAGS